MLLIKYLSTDIYRNSPFHPIPQCNYISTSKITFELSIQVGLLPLLGKSPSADSVGTFHPSSVSYTPLQVTPHVLAWWTQIHTDSWRTVSQGGDVYSNSKE